MEHGTLILGGGFGGLATATELRRLLGPEHPITVVDRRTHFYVGLRKLWVLVGRASLEEGERPRERLAEREIRFVHADILRIDPESRRVETSRGALAGDHLVVALGAVPRPDLIPGMAEHAFNLYDPESVKAAAERVTTLEEGRVGVVIAGLPYKCPPAPYECAFLLDDHFRERGVRDRIELTFTTLQPMLLPNAGAEGARWVGERLSARGIRWEAQRPVARFEEGRVVYRGANGPTADGPSLELDVTIGVPPHRAPPVVKESGLTGDGEWIRVDRGTLETAHRNVHAIGDVTHIPLAGEAALPKAGLFAEAEGLRVAAAIAARVKGEAEPAPFDGRGFCYLELSGREAALIQGDFFREPAPSVAVVESSPEHLAAKHRFEEERLEGWLGARG
jgi:sulfide:quinone oxidoreductase